MGPGEDEQGFSDQTNDVGSGDTGYYGGQANDAGDSIQSYDASGQSGSGQEAGECAVCYHEGKSYSEGDQITICTGGQKDGEIQVCRNRDGRMKWEFYGYAKSACSPKASASESGGEDSTGYGEGTEYAGETEEPAEYSNV